MKGKDDMTNSSCEPTFVIKLVIYIFWLLIGAQVFYRADTTL